jgi:hypothetical protein
MRKSITRRAFLARLTSSGLVVSANSAWGNWASKWDDILSFSPSPPDHLFLDAGAVGFKYACQNSGLTVGDTISFYPEIKIDQFDAIEDAVPSFRHLLGDIYEITFRPIDAFPNNLHKDCYHYLIELWPGFEVFHFNWIEKGDNYLRVNRWYKGYGRLGNCGDPSEENPHVPPERMKAILQRARVERIIENPLSQDYFENHCPWDEDKCYGYEDALARLGYWDNFQTFKKEISAHHHLMETASCHPTSVDSCIFRVKLMI